MTAAAQDLSWPLAADRFDAVLFDNDGTLINSDAAVVACWGLWAQELGLPPESLLDTHGLLAVDLVRKLVPGDGYAAALARIVELENTCEIPAVPLPGSHAALELLGERAAIVTSATTEILELRLAQTGLPRPAVIVTAADIEHGKPHPEPFLLAAQRLGADPARCLVVEDAPAGVQSGHAAGAKVLGIDSHAEQNAVSGGLGADAIVPNLAAVQFAIEQDEILVKPVHPTKQ